MSALLASIETWLLQFAHTVPVEIFAFVGAFVEEVIAPIPSPLVLTLTGSIAELKSLPAWYLLVLSVIGSFGKTLGAWLFYVVADKAEDVVLTRIGKFVGITHSQIESIGKKLSKNNREGLALFALRAIPIVPSSPISLICGMLKINLRTFIIVTFLGTILRNLIYLYFGYAGASTFGGIMHGFERAESVIQILIFGALGAAIVWIYWKRKKSGH